MGTIRIVETDSLPFVVTRDILSAEDLAKLSEGEHATSSRVHHPGSDDSPQLFEVSVPPDTEIAPHAHHEDEIIYVVDGALHLGAQVVNAGSSIFVAGETLYGFRSGPDGARFLNFRPRTDRQYFTKEEFAARRASARPQ